MMNQAEFFQNFSVKNELKTASQRNKHNPAEAGLCLFKARNVY